MIQTKFQNIKVLIWDIDGTMYDFRKTPGLHEDIRTSEYRVIENHTGWSRAKTLVRFLPLYKKEKSGTKSAAILSGIPVSQAALEGEKYLDRLKYIRPDPKLVGLFGKLKIYTHFMLVNGVQDMTKQVLKKLGLDLGIFTEIVTSEIVGDNKPSPKGFEYILNKTNLPPDQHLMIGDREEVDLKPAKKLGMKTCLVWSDKKSQLADVTLSTVYDVQSVLL